MKKNLLKRFCLSAISFCALFLETVEASETSDTTFSKSAYSLTSSSSFSLTKRKENLFDNPSSVYTVSSEDIRRSGATSIPEALRLVPGLQVARIDGSKWAITSRGFNRQFSSKLLVMIDGMNIYTSSFSGVIWDMHDYLIEDIERIEVIKGPGGTIWGVNAVDGLINIVTKSAIRTQGAYASQIVGNEDRSITEARYGGKTSAKDSYRIYGKKSVRDGAYKYSDKTDINDGNKQERVGFRYDVTSIKDNSVSLFGEVFKGVAESFFPTLNNNDENDKRYTGVKGGLNWNKKFTKDSETIFSSYYNYVYSDATFLRIHNQALDFDLQHYYNFSKDNQLTWGVGYRRVSDRIGWIPVNNNAMVSFDPAEQTYSIYSAIIQDKFAIIPYKLYATVGSKFSSNDYSGFEYQPSARLAYYPTDNQTLWAAVSRAVKIPNRSDRSVTVRADNSSVIAFKGSEKFDSENLMAYELGYRIKPTNRTMVDFASFYNRYSKLRTYELGETYNAVLPKAPTAANLAFGETYGFELTTKWQVNNDLALEANYEFIKLDIHISDNSTDNITVLSPTDAAQNAEGTTPKNQFKLKAFYNVTPEVEFDNILYYVDDLPKAGDRANTTGLPSYFRFDTRIGYIPTKNWDFSFAVKNLFDQRHVEFKKGLYGYKAETGRTFYFKVAWQY